MYGFRDVDDTTDVVEALGSEAMSLDGVYPENEIEGYKTLSVTGRESLAYKVSDRDRAYGSDGMEYFGKRQPSREITVRFRLTAPTAEAFALKFKELKAFCMGEERRIAFADVPNAYYIGTLMVIEDPTPGRLSVVSEMIFYCADPDVQSALTTSAAFELNDGYRSAQLTVTGNTKTYPVFKIKHIAENGYIGIVTPRGIFEMGNREEEDFGVAGLSSERLITGLSGFTPYTGTNPQNAAIGMNGTLALDGEWLGVQNVGTGSSWHGGCQRMQVPADNNGEIGAKNFYCFWVSKFYTTRARETGFQQLLLTDENNQLIAGIGSIKPNRAGNNGEHIFWVPGYGSFKSIEFNTNYRRSNAFYDRGWTDFVKEGSVLRFHYYGTYYHLDVPSLADKKVTYIYMALGQLASHGTTMTGNHIGKFYAVKNHEVMVDIPNRYPPGSEVVVDCANDKILINGLPRNEELVTGAVFPSLAPGTNAIEVYASPWCTELPEVTVEFKERWK